MQPNRSPMLKMQGRLSHWLSVWKESHEEST
jgi:hypothetical protein